jgi:Holliday junction resolvasome RuvABC ATP-dependent DNA helicase subunit
LTYFKNELLLKDNFKPKGFLNIMMTEIIGQEKLKSKLQFYIDGFTNSGIFPNSIFIAPKGTGKTHTARILGKVLKTINPNKKFIEVNSASLRSVCEFVDQLFLPHVNDSHVTLFFDEIHELNEKIIAMLLTVLNPTAQNKNRISHGDVTMEFDFKKFTFLGATTERQDVFPPLLDRLTELSLTEYNREDIAMIIQQNLFEGFTLENDASLHLANYSRGNARDAAKLGGKEGISNLLSIKNKNHGDINDVKELVGIVGLHPYGLTETEYSCIRFLNEAGASTLTNIANTIGWSNATQKSVETHLMRFGLIRIVDNSRREITDKGRNILELVKS